MLELSWTSIQCGVHLDRFGSIQPNMTNWRQLGLQLGPRQRSLGQVGPLSGSPAPSWGQPGQFLRIRRGTVTHVTAISILFWLWWPFVRSHVARACLGPSFGAKCPPQDHVVHAKPSLRPNVHKLRHVGPSSAQVGPKWAPVRPHLRPSKVGQVWPQPAFGWAKQARFFPRCPIPWAREVLVAKRREYVFKNSAR